MINSLTLPMGNNHASAIPVAVSSCSLHNRTPALLPIHYVQEGHQGGWGDLQSKASWPDLYSALRITQASTKETPYIAVEMPEHHRRSTALKWQNYLEDESDFFIPNE